MERFVSPSCHSFCGAKGRGGEISGRGSVQMGTSKPSMAWPVLLALLFLAGQHAGLALTPGCDARRDTVLECLQQLLDLNHDGQITAVEVNVALKSIVCLRAFGGVLSTIRRTSGMNPMSSIRSASSMTRISTMPRLMYFLRWKSRRRPGVATIMSTALSARSFLCLSNSIPPNTATTGQGVYRASRCASFSICRHEEFFIHSRVIVTKNYKKSCVFINIFIYLFNV